VTEKPLGDSSRVLVKDYLKGLTESLEGRPDQVKAGLEIYLDLWDRAIEKGIINEEDSVEDALGKLDEKGGLQKATES
jgi:hypothetical protein